MTGRFLSPDSIVPEPGNPQALNRYSYVLNNPLRYIDPTGHQGMPPDAVRAGECPQEWVDELEARAARYWNWYIWSLAIMAYLESQAAPAQATPAPTEESALEEALLELHRTEPRSRGRQPFHIVPELEVRNPMYQWFAGEIEDLACDVASSAERFATLDCLAFALDVGGAVATSFGPLGYPVAAGFYGASMGIDMYQHDFPGAGTSTGAWIVEPLTFSEYAPVTQALAKRVGYAAVFVAFASCLQSASR